MELRTQQCAQLDADLRRTVQLLKLESEKALEAEEQLRELRAKNSSLLSEEPPQFKPCPTSPQRAVPGADPVVLGELEAIKGRLSHKQLECDKYADEIHKLTAEMSEMNDRAIQATLEKNDSTRAIESELSQLQEVLVPELQSQIERQKEELLSQSEQLSSKQAEIDALMAEQRDRSSKTLELQTQLDELTASTKASTKKSLNNIKELKSQLSKEAGQAEMLEAQLAESREQLKSHQRLVVCQVCGERQQD